MMWPTDGNPPDAAPGAARRARILVRAGRLLVVGSALLLAAVGILGEEQACRVVVRSLVIVP